MKIGRNVIPARGASFKFEANNVCCNYLIFKEKIYFIDLFAFLCNCTRK